MVKKESKLEEIYGLVEYSQKTGIALTESQLAQIAEREEQYIKEEVLPLLRDSIEPLLHKIQRELTLVVHHQPDMPISLRISRDPNLADLGDAIQLNLDDVPEFCKRSKQQRNGKRKPNTVIKVTMGDGTVIFDQRNATNTFCEVIQQIGIVKVRSLEIIVCGMNIVSTSFDPNRQQRRIGDFYIFTNLSTARKAELLREISDKLHLSMIVMVVE